mmetsp:Transcript_30875/g.86165  ORF Transcript_30875/g.86165 Transcript_30875/m.86165 type:complete len:428 (-) Transcript_30875:101-1384(-)
MGVGASAAHPRDRIASEGRLGPGPPPPGATTVRFFVLGDIGHPGAGRARVATAMSRLQQAWQSGGELPASFVVSTGDQVYGPATGEAFDRLEAEVLCHLRLPWLACLGNHDVKRQYAGWAWNNSRHGMRSASGWSWLCPAPAYSLDHACAGLGGPVDIVVANTNKYRGVRRLGPPASGEYIGDGGPARPFYTSSDTSWWREQKRGVEDHFQGESQRSRRWRVVVGHHPSEYAEESGVAPMFEHRVPVARYFLSSFMRGGPISRSHRWGLSHVLRRHVDLYLCGHQHLMAHLRLASDGTRPPEEQRCRYAIVGSSSKTDQDDGDFDDAIDDGSPVSDASPSRTPASRDRVSAMRRAFTFADARQFRGDGSSGGRYSEAWVCRRLGFASILATKERLEVAFYEVGETSDAILRHAFALGDEGTSPTSLP